MSRASAGVKTADSQQNTGDIYCFFNIFLYKGLVYSTLTVASLLVFFSSSVMTSTGCTVIALTQLITGCAHTAQ